VRGHVIKLFLAGVLGVGGFVALPTSAALANTACGQGYNAGVSRSGSTYWGWCYPHGGYVRYNITVHCPWGGGGTTPWASGAGNGVVYTESETCWFGATADWVAIANG
jgi:hypothetical protein